MKVVITAAGLGTRLLPMSKELPKEMLPIFVKSDRGFILKPLLQALFEQLYEFGFREFCFVVGRGKRSIEDHFTPDRDFVRRLGISGKSEFVSDLEHFYDMIESSRIIFINQPEPRGFGHAVLMAKTFVGREPFMVCAGDTYIISKDKKFLKRMMDIFSYDVTAVLLLQKVSDPRRYGVAIVEEKVEAGNEYDVLKVIEKPVYPPSNLAIMPHYVFKSEIIDSLEGLEPGFGGEIQLTDAIQRLIDSGHKVSGISLRGDELRLDIGTPETYWDALKYSYRFQEGANSFK